MQVTSQLRTFSVEQGSLKSRVWGEGWTVLMAGNSFRLKSEAGMAKHAFQKGMT